jgi:O-antigen/teichoic acid export membrane protein
MNRTISTSRSLVWNLAGVTLPALTHLLVIPATVGLLGTERFGLFAVLWLWVGYFALFDFGLARALTRFVAERVRSDRAREMPELIATAMALIARFGTVGAIVAAAASPPLVMFWLAVPPALRIEAILSLVTVSVSLPWLILAGGWRAVLEAHGRFDAVNLLQIPVGIASALLPLIALWMGGGLIEMAAVLLAIRLVAWAAVKRIVLNAWPEYAAAKPNELAWRRILLSFGGWMTVSNTLGPLMVYLDRFMLGGLVSLAALTYYTASYELVTRAWLLAAAAIGIFFPAITAQLAADPARAGTLYRRAYIGVVALVLPPLTALSLFSTDILAWWLGPEFAAQGSGPLTILSAGVLINCVAQVSMTVVYAGGRADWVAKLHLLELPAYLFGMWWSASRWGLMGIAAAWTIRVGVDAIGMTWLANRVLPLPRFTSGWHLSAVMLVTVLVLVASRIETATIRLAGLAFITISCVALGARIRRRAIVAQV